MAGFRLALAISGAVSLGSYESGVMWEIINALKQHNEFFADKPDQHIHIDVITGASAGGMTAAILAQKLLYEGDRLLDPEDNDLYQPWVAEADVDLFMKMLEGDNVLVSLLSGKQIARLANRFLLSRYEHASSTPQNRHPVAAPSIGIGLAMANLNGVDYTVRGPNMRNLLDSCSDCFSYTRFQDRMLRTASPATDNKEFWNEVAVAARSCGAFPFAFPPLDVRRTQSDEAYEGADPFDHDPERFTYTDGGMFQNQPLGMAKLLVNQIDKHENADTRFYLYVSPNPKNPLSSTQFSASSAEYFPMAKQLAKVIFQQARYQDWVRTAKINAQVADFRHLALELLSTMESSTSPNGQEATVAGLSDLFGSALGTNAFQSAHTQAVTRLEQSFAQDLAARNVTESVKANWLSLVALLERTARLDKREVMNLYTITSTEGKLAGESLNAFGGFFDERYRQSDYVSGRTDAQTFLQALVALHGQDGNLPLDHVQLQPLPSPEFPAEVDPKDFPKQKRINFRSLLLDRVNLVGKDFNLWWITRKLISWFLRGKINKWLGL